MGQTQLYMLSDYFYLKIAHGVLPFRAVFIVGCGCDVKNLGPAMLVDLKVFFKTVILEPLSSFVVAMTLKSGPDMLVTKYATDTSS